MRFRTIIVGALAVSGPLHAYPGVAQEEGTRTERIRFEAGTTGSTVDGRITGYETVDYQLGARGGQTMTVSLTTDAGSVYFNLMAPGGEDVAFFNGSVFRLAATSGPSRFGSMIIISCF